MRMLAKTFLHVKELSFLDQRKDYIVETSSVSITEIDCVQLYVVHVLINH